MDTVKKFQVGHKKRILDRYKNETLESFEPYEVLEMILSLTIIRSDTRLLAKKLIESFGGLIAVMNTSIDELCTFDGIGEKSAATIKLFKDVNVYLLRDKLTKIHVFDSVDKVKDYLILKYRG